MAKIRNFFETRNFIHVETPLLSGDTVVDRYIDPVQINSDEVVSGPEALRSLYLQTSPEFAMKRLVAAGATAIYQICKAFRKGECGRKHNPEFTMLEWYRVDDDMDGGMALLAEFAQDVFDVDGVAKRSYREAFLAHAEIDPFVATIREMQTVCEDRHLDVASFEGDQERDVWLNFMMSEIVEPRLGDGSPEIIFHWPGSQAALARTTVCENGHNVAERFELFYGGVELANGYHELLDADELKLRNENVNAQRLMDGTCELPSESRLLAAMRHGMPACSGVALGVDRLMMVLMQADSIEAVIPFPFEIA